ncbi:MAG: HD domain-containing protein [Firmicutes bacterium]|jgi:predicted HD superfamily hydrolase involved in NAD metabolism|nr:HD domain-containing protein [Bacillota bacterium]
MLMYNEIKAKLKRSLTAHRYAHTLGVADAAVQLAQRYGGNEDKAYCAGLLHDCAKGLGNEELLQTALAFGIVRDDIERACPDLLHGPVGAMLAWKEFSIDDTEILTAVALHTLGAEKMGLLAKIIYIADYIEPNRSFPGVDDLRTLAQQNLDQAVLRAMDSTITYVLQQSLPLHPQTVRARNSMLLEAALYMGEGKK